MKVKIMDYETAKAEVLAREQDSYYADDKTVLGVNKTWAGWGQVRDVEKRFDNNFCDVEDGYVFPSYLIDKVTAKDVLRYGEILISEEIYNIRLRVISYNDSLYWLTQEDGQVIEFKEIGLAMK